MELNNIWGGIVQLGLAIVGIAIVAVIVSNNAQTSSVIGAAGSAFAKDISAAVSPVTGSSGLGLGFTGFGVTDN
jgi:PRD1 phage membrane DNA delivery